MTYEFDEWMSEISGMGGDYEQKCRTMLKAGLEWFDENPDADPKFTECEGIYGIIDINNSDAEALSKAVIASVGGCSGAMHHAVLSSVMWIRKNGWDAYVESMKR